MSEIRYDVVGIGNAIVDIIGRCDDDFLVRHDAPKGHMRLVDSDTISQLYDNMGPATESSGGSAANTLVGVASFGGSAAFIGKVASDEFGRIFAHDIRTANVDFHGKPVSGGAPTARSLILVTPDGERTMNTFLGISTELDQNEIDAAVIAASKIVYLEGYLFDPAPARAAFEAAAAAAHAAGRKVAITLSDAFVVGRWRAELLAFITASADIVLANEAELLALFETDDFDAAAARLAALVEVAAVTRGEHGSVVLRGSERSTIAAFAVDRVIDTTGAGDQYAAGFLLGLARGLSLEDAGALGSLAAAEVIGHWGPRPMTSLFELAEQKGLRLYP